MEDGYHHDFGDNKFPHYMGNETFKANYVASQDSRDTGSLSNKDLAAWVKYILKSVLLYLTQ